MKLTLFVAYSDGQDGSYSFNMFGTRKEALKELNTTEKKLEEENIYDDGAIEEIELEIEQVGNKLKLVNKPWFSVG